MTPQGIPVPDRSIGGAMRDYSFYTIPLSRTREGLSETEDHREVIRDHAKRGWSLVQVLSLADHYPPRLELIFTRKG